MILFTLFAMVPQTALPADFKIEEDQLRQDLCWLASDRMEGRMTGERGAELAARWIEARMVRAGLEPLEGRFVLPFAATAARLDEATRLQITKPGGTWERGPGEPFMPHPMSPTGQAQGDIVFAGYAIVAPELEYDDLWGLDLRGNIALVFRWEPQAEDRDSAFLGRRLTEHALLRQKIRACADRGAVAVLVADPPHTDQSRRSAAADAYWPAHSALFQQLVPMLQRQVDPAELAETNFRPEDLADQFACMLQAQAPISAAIPVAYVGRSVVDEVFQSTGTSPEEWAHDVDASGMGSGFSTTLTAHINITHQPAARIGWNIAGMLPGTDSDLKEECIVLGAHYDHVGRNADGDIWNGADDNGSGTVGLLQLMDAIANGSWKPKRTLVFVFFSAEELGLLGAAHFLASGAVPIDSIAAMVNLDMIGRAAKHSVHIIGAQSSPDLPSLVQQASAELDLSWGMENEEFFDRSDQAVFYFSGIPVVFFNTDEHPDYHTPRDTWDKVSYTDLAAITQMAGRLAALLADAEHRPLFQDGYRRMQARFGQTPDLLVPWPVPFHQRLDY
ncbi:MAG: M20/M25/M40 family metallo-hydrolase [Planctomycetes bacterium]|nr:M20/M25/M40 family metallo-hydrolase [Planctomycetota bacterium]